MGLKLLTFLAIIGYIIAFGCMQPPTPATLLPAIEFLKGNPYTKDVLAKLLVAQATCCPSSSGGILQ
jgi:hypothetical protein